MNYASVREAVEEMSLESEMHINGLLGSSVKKETDATLFLELARRGVRSLQIARKRNHSRNYQNRISSETGVTMNDNTRNAFASMGLEILKRATLQVLYEQHVNGIEYSGIKEVRELLRIPPTPRANHPNDMVCHFLLFLVDEKYVGLHTEE